MDGALQLHRLVCIRAHPRHPWFPLFLVATNGRVKPLRFNFE